MENPDKTAFTVHAVETSLEVINAIQELEEPGITEVASYLDLPKSTVFNHLKTLEQNQYLVKTAPDGYRLGLRFLDHGIQARFNLDLFEASSPAMEQLAEETELAVWLGVEEYGEVICIRKELGERAVPTRGKIGRRLNMHSSSLGKAILAHLPSDRIEEIVQTFGLPPRTDQTVTDRDELFKELEQIADRGFALNDSESTEGLRAVSSPIFDDEGICGSICVAGTRGHMKGEYFETELPARVKDAANEIELNLVYEP